jgi:hypothetical protein
MHSAMVCTPEPMMQTACCKALVHMLLLTADCLHVVVLVVCDRKPRSWAGRCCCCCTAAMGGVRPCVATWQQLGLLVRGGSGASCCCCCACLAWEALHCTVCGSHNLYRQDPDHVCQSTQRHACHRLPKEPTKFKTSGQVQVTQATTEQTGRLKVMLECPGLPSRGRIVLGTPTN